MLNHTDNIHIFKKLDTRLIFHSILRFETRTSLKANLVCCTLFIRNTCTYGVHLIRPLSWLFSDECRPRQVRWCGKSKSESKIKTRTCNRGRAQLMVVDIVRRYKPNSAPCQRRTF